MAAKETLYNVDATAFLISLFLLCMYYSIMKTMIILITAMRLSQIKVIYSNSSILLDIYIYIYNIVLICTSKIK